MLMSFLETCPVLVPQGEHSPPEPKSRLYCGEPGFLAVQTWL